MYPWEEGEVSSLQSQYMGVGVPVPVPEEERPLMKVGVKMEGMEGKDLLRGLVPVRQME